MKKIFLLAAFVLMSPYVKTEELNIGEYQRCCECLGYQEAEIKYEYPTIVRVEQKGGTLTLVRTDTARFTFYLALERDNGDGYIVNTCFLWTGDQITIDLKGKTFDWTNKKYEIFERRKKVKYSNKMKFEKASLMLISVCNHNLMLNQTVLATYGFDVWQKK